MLFGFRLDDLLSRIKEEVHRLQRRNQLKVSSSDPSEGEINHPTTDSTSLTNLPGHSSSSSNKQHLLTLKQVNMICARLLKEREEKIREEYDQILSTKLNGKRMSEKSTSRKKNSFRCSFLEQYEGFVRFTQDQLTRRFSELQFSCKYQLLRLSSSFIHCISFQMFHKTSYFST